MQSSCMIRDLRGMYIYIRRRKKESRETDLRSLVMLLTESLLDQTVYSTHPEKSHCHKEKKKNPMLNKADDL